MRLSLGFPTTALFAIGLIAQSGSSRRWALTETDRLHLPVLQKRPIPKTLPQPISATEYAAPLTRNALVSAMGGSITVGDLNGDSLPDLFVAVPGGVNALLRNNGNGMFEDVTSKARVYGVKNSLSATFADYDNSGHQSLFVAGVGGVLLYHNNGNGKFSDFTKVAGLRRGPGEVCTRALVSDFDGDGFPDLLLTVYTDLNQPPAKTSFVFPNDFGGATTRLFRNDGKGSFTDITAASGLSGNPGRARNAIIADFNSDHHPDLLILRDDKPPALYLNRGNGNFVDATWDAGDELTGHAFFDGLAADFNGDGKPDLALWSTVSFRILLNDGKGKFKNMAAPSIVPPSNLFGFRGVVADFSGTGFPGVLTSDSSGCWHLLTNEVRRFTQVPLSLPSLAGSVAGTSLFDRSRKALYLLALRPDGSITALESIAVSATK
ncbi:MAG TPA: VCBS repeat-containing protein [Terriglobales bacterium]|nr:VCBS repeat-containing protein [Terriglobales bacterium]